jgi:hypothetical protein
MAGAAAGAGAAWRGGQLWRDGPRYCVGVAMGRIAPGRTEVRLCGEGVSWRDAVTSIPLGVSQCCDSLMNLLQWSRSSSLHI